MLSTDEKLSIGLQFKRLGESINNQIWEVLNHQKIEIDVKEWLALKSIRSKKDSNVQHLAEVLHVSHPAVVQLINILSRNGYVTSEKSKADRRNTFFRLTEKGENFYSKVEPFMTEVEQSLLLQFSGSGYDVFDFVSKIVSIIGQNKLVENALRLIKVRQMNEVRIIPYSKKYKTHFRDLNIEWLNKYFTVEPADEKILTYPEKEIINKGGEIFFALLGEQVVGTCAVVKIDNVTFEISKMAVTEKTQGKQIGKKLGLTAIGFAVAKNADKIVLDTNHKLDAAINLYRGLGFLFVPHKYDNKYQRELLRMELSLK